MWYCLCVSAYALLISELDLYRLLSELCCDMRCIAWHCVHIELNEIVATSYHAVTPNG